MHQTEIKELGLYNIYFYRRFSERDREPPYGKLIDEKEMERVLRVLGDNYQNKIVGHMSIITGYVQYLIEGVSVTIPRENKEGQDYMALALTSESAIKIKGLVEKLGLPFDNKKLIYGEKELIKWFE